MTDLKLTDRKFKSHISEFRDDLEKAIYVKKATYLHYREAGLLAERLLFNVIWIGVEFVLAQPPLQDVHCLFRQVSSSPSPRDVLCGDSTSIYAVLSAI